MRERTSLQPDALKIKERFYLCGQELLQPINIMISDSYPVAERSNDIVQMEEYVKAKNRGRAMLYEQRNNVQDRWLPRYDITHIGKFVHTEDWDELKGLLIDGALDRLAERLISMCPLMVKAQYVKATEEAVARVLTLERATLEGYLRSFHVQRIKGIPTIAQEYGN